MSKKEEKKLEKQVETAAPIADKKRGVPKRTILRGHVEIRDERLLLPQSLIASAFDVSIDTVTRWDVRPVVKIGRESMFYLPEVIEFRNGGGDGVPKLNPAQEKAQLDKAKREKLESDLQHSRGELISIADVEKDLEKELVAVRQKLYALPNKLAMELRAKDDPAQIKQILMVGLNEALEGLNYGGRIPFASEGTDSPNVATAAEPQPS